MSDTEILEKIKKAEEEAEARIAEARQSSAKVKDDAKAKAVSMLSAAKAEADTQYKAAIASAEKEAEVKYSKIIASAKKKASSMKSISRDDAIAAFEAALKEEFGV